MIKIAPNVHQALLYTLMQPLHVIYAGHAPTSFLNALPASINHHAQHASPLTRLHHQVNAYFALKFSPVATPALIALLAPHAPLDTA